MKISTKFNLFVGFFFFFVIMAVLYSYCGGLNVCYSFPFLNGIGRGSVSKAKAMMTSYIIDEKGGSRDDVTDTIYFYGKIKGSSNKIPKVYHGKEDWERKPHERKKTGSSSDDPPSDITGKVAEEMLRKANISLEESNRELYREEKVDRKVDREDLKTMKSMPTQSTPIAGVREGMGSTVLHSRVHPIRKPPRKLKKKKLLKNRMNRLAKQDLARQNIERSQKAMRMREDGRGKQLQSRDRMSVHDKINGNQTKEKQKNYVNEAVSPYDALKHRNEALSYTRQENETKRKYETLSLQINAKQSHNGAKINSSQKKIPEKKLVSDANKSGRHGNESVTSSGVVPLKRSKLVETRVDEVSGSGEDRRMDHYSSLTTGELIMSIGNIKEKNVRLALQSALKKDEQQLQNDVMKIKNSYQEIHKPFNLTSVLKELVKAAESADKSVIENAPGSKQGRLVMKRRDNDRPLIRVKRLGKIKRRNKDSERTLVRVKRIEEDDAPRNLNKELDVQVKRLDSIDDDNVLKTVQKRNLNSGQKETQRKQSTSEEKDKVGSEVLLLKRHKVFNNFLDYKQKDKEQNAERVRNTTMAKLIAEPGRQRRNGLKSLNIQNSNQNYPKNILKGKAPRIISNREGFRNPSSKSRQDFLARTKRVDLDDE